MDISDFFRNYKNHPILFIGTGLSLRYLNNSFTWDSLLSHINSFMGESEEHYLDIKSKCQEFGSFRYDKIASIIEQEFNLKAENERNGKFSSINDLFYDSMKKGLNLSRFKLYISDLFSTLDYKEEKSTELVELKKIRKNIGSIITTNYDTLIEDIFGFEPLIGNNILLSNPYGSVYKIHGSTGYPADIIITENDYRLFDSKYELIRAQLLSLFIHNPIIFLGYNIGDSNIKKILKTIFTYVSSNSDLADRIRNNFLLVEYAPNSYNHDVVEHDIDIADLGSTIRINKLKTDDFSAIYKLLSELVLPISAMDVRKVQSVVKNIYAGGNIKVRVTENLDDMENSQTILAIGSAKSITYQVMATSDLINNYFEIIEEENVELLRIIDKLTISSSQYFPIFGFSLVNHDISNSKNLKQNQVRNIKNYLQSKTNSFVHHSINDVFADEKVGISYKYTSIIFNVLDGNIELTDLESYLRKLTGKRSTDDRRLLCLYDYLKYGGKLKKDRKGRIILQ